MKYSSTNKPLVCMQTQSTCYKGTSKMTVKGVLWHSTGANNPTLKRYVQPSDVKPAADTYDKAGWLKVLGKNTNNNDWNHITRQAGLNAWIGKLADSSITSIQTMPWDFKPWGCGSGTKGSCNNGWIQFEICEDALTDKKYFDAVYKEACELTAYLCEMYNIDPKGTVTVNGVKVPTILCHQDSYKLGLGSNHSDILHWFKKQGKTMDDVRNDVAKLMGKESAPAPTGEMYRVRKSWADAKSQIGAYTVLENAKKACKDGYFVFDSKGNIVFPEKEIQVAPPAPVKKSNTEIAQEVIAGKWGNGETRKTRLQAAGYDYNAVQAEVGRLMKKPEPPKPVLKSVDVIAAEVMAGKWGNGDARKQALIKAGYDYAAVQAAVNKLAKGETKPAPKPEPPKPAKKSNAEIAKEVMAGKWGNGEDRKKRLQAAGYDYSAIQAEVNKLAGSGSKGYKVQVTASALNVRAGAGTNYKVVKVVRKGQTLTIIAEKSGWGQLSDKSGWVSLNYTKKV